MKFKNLLALFIFSLAMAIPNIQFGRTINSSTGGPLEGPFAYAYIYNETVQKLEDGDSVSFDSHGPMEGIRHEAGSSEITFDNDGVYMITFLTVSPLNASFALFLNDKLIEGSTYGSYESGDRSRSGQTIVNVKTGDKLSLKRYTPIFPMGPIMLRTSNLQTVVGIKEPSVNASINIVQID